MPALPPFKGPAGAPARAPLPPVLTSDTRKAPPPFVGARPANGSRPAPNAHEESAPAVHAGALPALTNDVTVPATERDVDLHGRDHERRAVREAMDAPAPAEPGTVGAVDLPWLDTSGAQSSDAAPSTATDAIPFPPFDSTPSEPAAPEEAAQALAGLPYFDGDGDKHEDGGLPSLRASGRMHRIEADPASVLERLAARIRSGELRVPDVDPIDGDPAALAAVLAALLRRRS